MEHSKPHFLQSLTLLFPLFAMLATLPCACGTQAMAAVSQQEKDALTALYNGTNGSSWTENANWNNGDPCENNWHGITCNSSNSSVVQINLPSNNLSGYIPTELGNLANLQYLYLQNNQLSGAIPTTIGNMNSLRTLDLSHNQLSGAIPATAGNLNSLAWLYLQDNQLSGDIPGTLGNLSNLQYMYLYDNRLSGPIPETIGNLSSLTILYLYNNQLCGAIPETLTNLTTLFNDYGMKLDNNNLDTDVSPALDTFIQQKSGGDTWKSTQGHVETCGSQNFPWPIFLPAVTGRFMESP